MLSSEHSNQSRGERRRSLLRTCGDRKASKSSIRLVAETRYYAGGMFGLGRSELYVSSRTFHVPSACFFHTVTYFPLSEIIFPDASFMLKSYVPLV
jgi:hypothetical protein